MPCHAARNSEELHQAPVILAQNWRCKGVSYALLLEAGEIFKSVKAETIYGL